MVVKYNSIKRDYNDIRLTDEDVINIIYMTNELEDEKDITLDNTKLIISNIRHIEENTYKERIENVICNFYSLYSKINKICSENLTIELLKYLHSVSHKGLNIYYSPGEFRQSYATIGEGKNINFSSPDWIEDDLYLLFNNYNKKRLHFKEYSNEEVLDIILWLKCKIIDIHPFEDGNGRLSRFIIQKELLYSGLPFSYFKGWNKKEYREAMYFSHINGDRKKLKNIYLREIQDKLNWI